MAILSSLGGPFRAVLVILAVIASSHVISFSSVSKNNEIYLEARPVQDPDVITEKIKYSNESKLSLSDLESFDNDWKEMKEAMCPKMIPNRKVFKALFQLARMELKFANLGDFTDPIHTNFFNFSEGGVGYKNGNSSAVYLAIWKGGNNFIRFNWLDHMGLKVGNASFEAHTQRKLYRTMGLIDDNPGPKNAPCIVTVVRDPISHFLSGYNEVEWRNMYFPEEKRLPQLGQDPLLFTRFQIGSTQRFSQFVNDFLAGPTRADFFNPEAEFTHFYSMTGVLFQLHQFNNDFEKNWTLSAYLPSQANLTLNFPKMLIETCPNMPPEVDKAFPPCCEHKSSEDEFGFYRAAKHIWNEGGDTARALCALHTLDYACYDKIPIPDLCKQVYAKKEFISYLNKSMTTIDEPHLVNEKIKPKVKAIIDESVVCVTYMNGKKVNLSNPLC